MLYNVLVGFVFAQLHYTTKRLLPFFFWMQPFLLFFYSALLLFWKENQNYFLKRVLNLSMASAVSSWVLNAVSLNQPSPLAPKPAPGVPTTWISLSR